MSITTISLCFGKWNFLKFLSGEDHICVFFKPYYDIECNLIDIFVAKFVSVHILLTYMFRWIITPLCHYLADCSASILTQAGGPGSQGTTGGRRVPKTCMACKSRLLHSYCRGLVSISRPSFQVWYFHYKDKIVVRPSCLYNGNPYPGKTASLYWDGFHVPGCSRVSEIWGMASNWLVWPVVWLAESNIYWGTTPLAMH